jgi:hypothetical protein
MKLNILVILIQTSPKDTKPNPNKRKIFHYLSNIWMTRFFKCNLAMSSLFNITSTNTAESKAHKDIFGRVFQRASAQIQAVRTL